VNGDVRSLLTGSALRSIAFKAAGILKPDP
jgi:hypothetical protein